MSNPAVTRASGQGIALQLAERGTRLSNGLWVREIRKLTERGHQTALLATDYGSALGPVAVLPRVGRDGVGVHPHHVGDLPAGITLAPQVDHPTLPPRPCAGVLARCLVELVQLRFGQFQVDHLQA